MREPSAVFGTVVLGVFIVAAIAAPVIAPHDPKLTASNDEEGGLTLSFRDEHFTAAHGPAVAKLRHAFQLRIGERGKDVV